MTCPRCRDTTITAVASSPVPGSWQVLACERCRYFWRTTEPATNTEPRRYPERFRLSATDIDTAKDVPTVPPRRNPS